MSSPVAAPQGASLDESAESRAPGGFWDQPRAVWATVFSCVVGFMSIGLVDPILTSIAAGLNAGPAQVSLLFTSYFLVTSVMMLVTGFVSSRIGARQTLLLGAALIVVFAALAGTSTSIRELVAFRAGWGLGNAFFVVTALSVLVGVTTGGTGKAVLLYEAAIGLGLSVGPLLGAALGAQSWRWPFFGTATLMGIGLVSVLLFLPALPKPARKISLTAPLRALAHPGLFTISLSAFFYYFAFFAVLAFAPFVLQMSAYAVGGIFFGWGLLLALFSVFVAPRLEARFGIVPVASGALVVLAVLLIGMGLGNRALIAAAVILSGAVMGICNTLFTELALEVSDAPRPVASAGYNFLRWFAGVIAPFTVPRIAEHSSPLLAFGVAAVAALIAPLVILLRRKSIAAGDVHVAPAAEAAPVAPIATPQTARIVAAVDGSASDLAVIAQALTLARTEGVPELALLHVRIYEILDGDAASAESRDESQALLARAVARVEAEGLIAQPVTLLSAPGAAARAAINWAESHGASHLVVGPPHRDALDDILHGSFAASAEQQARVQPTVAVVVAG